ncbi:MAG TPA: zf-TFIIB domain-containing protein [Gemmatimonadales bacterium]
MPDTATRYACPVCLGVKLVKLQPTPGVELILDYCTRCGGMWFDEGEVSRLRTCHPRAFAALVAIRADEHRMRCHGCGAAVPRNAARCAVCGWRNVLACPSCGGALAPVERDGSRLDVCGRCRGVWFDNVELGTIWNAQVSALARRQPGAPIPVTYSAHHFLLDAVLWGPDLVWHGAAAAGQVVTGAGSVLADGATAVGAVDLAEVAGAVVEGTGSLAGSVFEAIAEIVAGLFS